MENIDLILIILSGILIIVGIIGSVIPAIPDVTLSFAGILLYKFSSYCQYSWTFVIIAGLITAFAMAADYLIPAWGNKRFGGSKWGAIGCIVGLIIGAFFFPPIGMIIGCFVGAVLFEMLFDQKQLKPALKAGLGSFLGYISSMILSLVVTIGFAFFYFREVMPLIENNFL